MTPNIALAIEDAKKAVRGFFFDYKRLWGASKGTALLLALAHAYIGLFPVLELVTLYGLTDALIGARGLGISTKDVTTFMWYQMVILFALIPAVFFSSQISGTTKRLGWTVSEMFFLTSIFLAALPASPILLFILLSGMFFIHYVPFRFAKLVYSLVVLLLMVNNFHSILDVAIHRGATIGQAVILGGSLLVFSTYIALRPYVRG